MMKSAMARATMNMLDGVRRVLVLENGQFSKLQYVTYFYAMKVYLLQKNVANQSVSCAGNNPEYEEDDGNDVPDKGMLGLKLLPMLVGKGKDFLGGVIHMFSSYKASYIIYFGVTLLLVLPLAK